MKTITIHGKEYPVYITMGALLRYRHMTGCELKDMAGDDTAGMITFIWCCVMSAANAEGVEFNYSLQDFADNIRPNMIAGLFDDVAAENSASDDEANPRMS